MKNIISYLLNSKKTYKYLLISNGILACILFYLFRDFVSGDEKNYLSYAQGLDYGRFSQWWFLPNYVPDTISTPGYPFFLFLIEKISSGLYFIKAIQLLLYSGSVFLILKIASQYDSGYRLKNIFLILLLPYVQVSVFAMSIQPESLLTFLITLFLYIDSRNLKPEWKYSALGLLSGCIYLVRPSFLFFPILLFAFKLITQREKFPVGLGISMLVIYFLSIMPYGIWNLKNHNVISITPIEGAGGKLSLGYWSFKMPGYYEKRYLGNSMSNEIFSFTPKSETKNNIHAYNKEWDYIDSACAQYLSPQDYFNLAEMNNYNGYYKTYNAKYTIEREKLLKKLTMKHLKEEPIYTLKTKLFTLARLWFTGLQLSELQNPNSGKQFFAIYFSIVSALFFLASLILIPVAFYKKKISWAGSQTAIILITYYGLAHIAFALQAKYTIPLRLIVLLLLARTIHGLFSNESAKKPKEDAVLESAKNNPELHFS